MKKKSEIFLKIIIALKFILGSLAFPLSFGILSLINKDMDKFARGIVDFFKLDTNNYIAETIIRKIGVLESGTIIGISIGTLLYSILNLVEGYGLHKRRRWAEWLTVTATAALIPFELYEVMQEQTIIRIGVLILNSAIVYYLARHKELFKRRRKQGAR